MPRTPHARSQVAIVGVLTTITLALSGQAPAAAAARACPSVGPSGPGQSVEIRALNTTCRSARRLVLIVQATERRTRRCEQASECGVNRTVVAERYRCYFGAISDVTYSQRVTCRRDSRQVRWHILFD